MKLDEKNLGQLLKSIPLLAVDGVLIREDRVMLLQRDTDPYKNSWVLPGGFLDYGERLEDGVTREFEEETRIMVRTRSIVNIYSHPHRDPRGHIVSVAYLCDPLMTADLGYQVEQNPKIDFFPIEELPSNVGFDHAKIIVDAVSLKQTLDNR